MRVFVMSPHDNVQRLAVDVHEYDKVLRSLGQGAPAQGEWVPPVVHRELPVSGWTKKTLCDLTAIGALVKLPVLSARAKAVLAPAIGEQAQWLPLVFDEAEYWALNCLHAIDVLDDARSNVRHFSHGPVRDIHTYAFRSEAIADEWLFKVTPTPYDVLVTQKFQALVAAHELTGFYFRPVWDSEYAPFPARPSRAELAARRDVFGPGGIVRDHEEFWPDAWKEERG